MSKLKHIGRVKFFDATKGFGFIEDLEDHQEHFVHVSKLKEEALNDNDYVAFNLKPSKRKSDTYEAVGVRLVVNYYHNVQAIKDALAQHNHVGFRKEILGLLSKAEVLEIFNQELKLKFNESDERGVEPILHVFSFYVSLSRNKDFHDALKQLVKHFSANYASEEIQVSLWLEDLVSEQPDTAIIKRVFQKINNRKIEASICSKLGIEDVLDLIRSKVQALEKEPIELDLEVLKDFKSFIDVLKFEAKHRETVDGLFEELTTKKGSAEAKWHLWLEGLLQKQPEDSVLERFFKESSQAAKEKVFNLIELPTKLKLTESLVHQQLATEGYEFIIKHISKHANISYPEARKNILRKEFWDAVPEYSLYKRMDGLYRENLPKEELFDLGLEGLTQLPGIDFIISIIPDLSIGQIEKLLKKFSSQEQERLQILLEYLVIELDRLEKSLDDETISRNLNRAGRHESADSKMSNIIRSLQILSTFDRVYLEGIGERIISQLPSWACIRLWELNLLDSPHAGIFEDFINKFLDDILAEVDYWGEMRLLKTEDYLKILKPLISIEQQIGTPQDCKMLFAVIDTLIEKEYSVDKIISYVAAINLKLAQLHLWLEEHIEAFNFEAYKVKVPLLSAEDQILFLKKLFWLHHSGKESLTVSRLDEIARLDLNIHKITQSIHGETQGTDISLEFVIEAIKKFSKEGEFPNEGELLKVVLQKATNISKPKFVIASLFEACKGRMEAVYDWNTRGDITKTPFGINKFYWAISFKRGEEIFINNRFGGYTRFEPNPHFEELVAAVKRLPKRKWNPDKEHWGIPSSETESVKQFAAEHKFFIDEPGSNYANNTHLVSLVRKDIPNGITYCEGREANQPHRVQNRSFWWCTNMPCFGNCKTIHSAEDWRDYNFLDFMRILDFNMNDTNRVGDVVEDGKYYQFISLVNRFSRLLERIYCRECEGVLHPVEDSHFAHYRVVRFQCRNSGCTEHEKEVYLHHCLNGKCNSIIDSRDSKKCPHGLYVCSNNSCGCCCSHAQQKRRLDNLRNTGGYIHPELEYQVEQKKGHLERAEHFCYKCATKMVESEEEVFDCPECGNHYDLRESGFKREHRHLTGVDEG